MICSFANAATEDLFNGVDSRRARAACPRERWPTVRRKLTQLNRVRNLKELAIELGDEIYWAFLSFGPQRRSGRHALSPEQRRTVARCVPFLQISEPHEWLERTKWDEVRALLRLQAWHHGGDTRVWPFFSGEQLAKLTACPAFGQPRDRAV